MMNPAARQPNNVPNEVQWLVLAHAAHVCASQRHLEYVQVDKLRSKKFRGPVACQDWTPRFKLFRRWLSRQGRCLQRYMGHWPAQVASAKTRATPVPHAPSVWIVGERRGWDAFYVKAKFTHLAARAHDHV